MKTSYLRHISLGPLLWLAACGGDDGTTTPPAPSLLGPLEATMDATILPALDQMATEATAARTAAEAMCSAPDEARLTALQDSWRDLYEAYNRAGAYGFGPLDDDPIVPRIYFIDPMRQRGTDYTETVRATLTQALTDPTMLTADDVDALTFNRVGLIALEVLSFEATTSSQSTAAANIVAQLGDADACTYLTGVARGLESRSQAVAEEWKTPSADGPSFRDRMATANLPDGSDPVATLLLGLLDYTDYVKTRKLEGLLDAQLAGHFYPGVLAGLSGVRATLDAPDGFLSLLEPRGDEAVADAVRAALTAAEQRAEAQDRDGLATEIGRLEGLIRRDLADALFVTLGINFTDGD